jgi:nucleotide-binding universal stress UspA family protein
VRVLIAIDGSPPAQRCIALIAAQSWPAATELRVLLVDDGRLVSPDAGGDLRVTIDAFDAAIQDPRATYEIAVALATQAARPLERTGSTVTVEVLRGRAATAIVAEGRRFEADLIVVGSRGRGRLQALALGSVSAEVVDHAERPVLVARGEGPMRRIVLAVDGSAGAARALQVVAEWPMFADAEITVSTVAHVPAPLHSAIAPTMIRAALTDYERSLDEARAARDRIQESAASVLRAAGRKVTVDGREGDPASEILAAAKERAADVVVVGSRGQTGLTRLLLGSVARNVLYEAPCSVLVVH